MKGKKFYSGEFIVKVIKMLRVIVNFEKFHTNFAIQNVK